MQLVKFGSAAVGGETTIKPFSDTLSVYGKLAASKCVGFTSQSASWSLFGNANLTRSSLETLTRARHKSACVPCFIVSCSADQRMY